MEKSEKIRISVSVVKRVKYDMIKIWIKQSKLIKESVKVDK